MGLVNAKALHVDDVFPVKKSMTRGELSGDALDLSFWALSTELVVGLIDVVGLSDKT